MKLCQFFLPGLGRRAGMVERDEVIDLTGVNPDWISVLAILTQAEKNGQSVPEMLTGVKTGAPVGSYRELDRPQDTNKPHLLIPVDAPEVWGFGVTYKKSADIRDDEAIDQGIYNRVYGADRPELFYKASRRHCVGPNGTLNIRSDSASTATEPEMAYVVSSAGSVIGYTACNDFSAWDIERENPLYLPQSKIYNGCCAIGPVITTVDEIGDGWNLRITCRLFRDGEIYYEGSINSNRISRSQADLNDCLLRDNSVLKGTVVSTGTGIMVPMEHCHQDGDVVEIEIEKVGVLRNTIRKLGK